METTWSDIVAAAEEAKTAFVIDKPGAFVRVMVDIQAQLRTLFESEKPARDSFYAPFKAGFPWNRGLPPASLLMGFFHTPAIASLFLSGMRFGQTRAYPTFHGARAGNRHGRETPWLAPRKKIG